LTILGRYKNYEGDARWNSPGIRLVRDFVGCARKSCAHSYEREKEKMGMRKKEKKRKRKKRRKTKEKEEEEEEEEKEEEEENKKIIKTSNHWI